MREDDYFNEVDTAIQETIRGEEEWLEYVQAWKNEYPNHCTKCCGYGYNITYQSHPYGSTTATETLYEPCDCVMVGRCPRCGELGLSLVEEEEPCEGPCTFCQWNNNEGI